MINYKILNPDINSLLCRVRHTNTLVIADRGFPFWPNIETIDITLCNNIPTVLDVLKLVLFNFNAGCAYMADEFKKENSKTVLNQFKNVLGNIPVKYEPHDLFKKHVPDSIGLIRTADTIQYANIILESA
jgi:D-ribose pyranase